MDVNSAMTLLKKSKVFASLDDSVLDTLIFLAYTKHFNEGDTIYTKGEPSNDRFAMITSGSVNIVAKDGTVAIVVGSGNVIGEIALSDPNHKRTATVTAAESAELLEWDVNYIKEKIPDVWKKLLKLAWEHMREFYEDIE